MVRGHPGTEQAVQATLDRPTKLLPVVIWIQWWQRCSGLGLCQSSECLYIRHFILLFVITDALDAICPLTHSLFTHVLKKYAW